MKLFFCKQKPVLHDFRIIQIFYSTILNEILNIIQKIKESKQPVITYFKQYSVPFSRVQYHRYCKTLQKYGEEGLRDKRKDGNYTK